MADSVADILGCPLDMAVSLLEAAGGDPQLAIELGLGGGLGGGFIDGGAGGGDNNNDGGGEATATSTTVASTSVNNAKSIWPEESKDSIPDSWKKQRLDSFFGNKAFGIIQPLNGPCGLLSVIQAEIWLLLQHKEEETGGDGNINDTSSSSSGEALLTKSIYNILSRIVIRNNNNQKKDSNSSNSSLMMVTLPSAGDNDDDGKSSSNKIPLDEASKTIRTASELVEIAATTYGLDKLRSSTSLIEGPHWLCSSDLMCLLLTGTISNSGSFGAYNSITKRKVNFYDNDNTDDSMSNNNNNNIGLLSMMEIDEGIPIADDLKFCTNSCIWIVHTGDHFVTMRRKGKQNTTSNVVLEVYDGLKPNGPIIKTFELSGNTNLAEKAPNVHTNTFRKKRVGQPDDIVQSKKKNDSKNYKEWTFEVVPSIDDPDVHGPIDDDPNEPIYDYNTLELPAEKQQQKWRCATCYSQRFKTMNFGLNNSAAAGSENCCEACNLPIRKAMWSLWLPYDGLSPRMKKRARIMYATKLELTISTLYPYADIIEKTDSN